MYSLCGMLGSGEQASMRACTQARMLAQHARPPVLLALLHLLHRCCLWWWWWRRRCSSCLRGLLHLVQGRAGAHAPSALLPGRQLHTPLRPVSYEMNLKRVQSRAMCTCQIKMEDRDEQGFTSCAHTSWPYHRRQQHIYQVIAPRLCRLCRVPPRSSRKRFKEPREEERHTLSAVSTPHHHPAHCTCTEDRIHSTTTTHAPPGSPPAAPAHATSHRCHR